MLAKHTCIHQSCWLSDSLAGSLTAPAPRLALVLSRYGSMFILLALTPLISILLFTLWSRRNDGSTSQFVQDEPVFEGLPVKPLVFLILWLVPACYKSQSCTDIPLSEVAGHLYSSACCTFNSCVSCMLLVSLSAGCHALSQVAHSSCSRSGPYTQGWSPDRM